VLDEHFIATVAALVVEMRLAGKISHGRGAGLVVPVPVSMGADAAGTGFKACGSVARAAAASPVGKYSGPFCPQPERTSASPRIAATFNIGKL
jgi:hypothetical protein